MPIDPAEVPAAILGRRVAVLVSGGIAVYKVADLVSQLGQAGCDVKVAMTASAGRFVGAATFMGLSGHPVQSDLFANAGAAEPHVALGDWAQVALVAPATANLIAKLAGGHSDDLVTATVLAARCPVVIAPAMNDAMWAKPAVAENLDLLRKRGFTIVAPTEGRLASGHTGNGQYLAGAPEISLAALPTPRSAPATTWRVGGSSLAPAEPVSRSTRCVSSATTRAARWATPSRRPPPNEAQRWCWLPPLPTPATPASAPATWNRRTRCWRPSGKRLAAPVLLVMVGCGRLPTSHAALGKIRREDRRHA